MGLDQAVALCMDHCYSAELGNDDSWFKTIILAGGTACLPGLPGKASVCVNTLSFLFSFNFSLVICTGSRYLY